VRVSSADANGSVWLVNTETPLATGVDLRLSADARWPQQLRPGPSGYPDHTPDSRPVHELSVALSTLLLAADQFLYEHLSLLNGDHFTNDYLTCQLPGATSIGTVARNAASPEEKERAQRLGS
jgi:hypothetical protein